MKVAPIALLSLLGILLVGCGKNEPTSSATAAPAPSNEPKTFALTANDTMKYNITQLDAKAGEQIKLTLTNAGSMPKDAMAHNWVLLQKGSDPTAFANAAVTHRDNDYFPSELSSEVIAHTKLLGPKQSDTITFNAPTQPGEYTYLCTFPGHYVSGMHGTLTVH